jgi:hypothetical protein
MQGFIGYVLAHAPVDPRSSPIFREFSFFDLTFPTYYRFPPKVYLILWMTTLLTVFAPVLYATVLVALLSVPRMPLKYALRLYAASEVMKNMRF